MVVGLGESTPLGLIAAFRILVMIRYRLRTLLILVAIAPLMLAAAWYWWEGDEFGPHRSDADIRARLLQHTPVNTKAEDVLKFVLKDHGRRQYVQAYWNYFHYVQPSADPYRLHPNKREISTIVGSRAAGLLLEEDVNAIWHFDKNDRLTDITVDRFCVGP